MTSNSNSLRVISLVTLTVQNAAVAISMRYSRTRGGDLFITSTAVVMAEVLKCVASLFLVYKDEQSVTSTVMCVYTRVWKNKVDTLKVCVPAFVYLIQNNLLYVSASNLDAATYQVTYQMKILTTAMFAILILGRTISKIQWGALMVLIFGVALVQTASTTSSAPVTLEQSPLIGFIAAIGACCCSGFAGIYFEKILKTSDISVWMRNVQLSLASIPLGLLTCLASDWQNIRNQGFFFGYDSYVWYLVALNAVGGLLVAMVVKYADNILKNFATSIAIVLAMIASVYLFNMVLTLQYLAGTVLVILSIFMYSYQPSSSAKNTVPLAPPVMQKDESSNCSSSEKKK